MSEATAPDWMTVTEAVTRLGRDRAKVYRWLRRDPQQTGIRVELRSVPGVGRIKFVEYGSLVAYTATLGPGRPPARK